MPQAAAKKTAPAAGRPREQRATEAILQAALELGEESGFDGLTIEGIAARAGVGKTTIYRRWTNVWAIVADAFLADVDRIAPVQQLATARESFAFSMRLVAKSFRGRHGRILRPLIARAQFDPQLRQALAGQWLARRRELSRAIIRHGIAAGELRHDLDPDIALDALYGPLYHRLLLPYDESSRDTVPISDAYIEALVDTVFQGLARR